MRHPLRGLALLVPALACLLAAAGCASLQGTGDKGYVSGDGSPEQAKSFVRHFEVPYRSFYSPDGQALLQFQGTLSPRTIPSTVVLDDRGRVAASIIGQIPSTTTLVDVVRDVAKGATDGSGSSTSGGGANADG